MKIDRIFKLSILFVSDFCGEMKKNEPASGMSECAFKSSVDCYVALARLARSYRAGMSAYSLCV